MSKQTTDPCGDNDREMDSTGKTGVGAKNDSARRTDGYKTKRQARELESRVLRQKLAEQGQCLIEIPPDGHCLFSAISDQLRRVGYGEEHSYKSLRKLAAEYMLQHETHFRDFLPLQKQSFRAYCRKVRQVR